MTTNAEFLAAYDLNALQSSHRLYSPDEHTSQVLCAETLRILMASLMTPSDYNNLSDAAWANIVNDAVAAANLISGVNTGLLRSDHIQAAANLGGNYFEHSYQFIMDGTPLGCFTTFRKLL